MSFLMFAARKIQIKRLMNSKNYELTLITEQANEAARKVANAQEAQTAAKNQVSVFTSQLQQSAQFQALAALKNQTGIDANGMNSGNMSQSDLAAIQKALMEGSQAGSQLATAITSITDSIFSEQNKAELSRLQAQQQTLDMRKETLQTQLKSLQGEYQVCESAESESAKSLAPKFGIA